MCEFVNSIFSGRWKKIGFEISHSHAINLVLSADLCTEICYWIGIESKFFEVVMGFSFSVVLDVGAPVLRRPTRCSATRRLTTAARRRRINRASTSRSCTRTATSTTHWPTTATTTVGLRSTLRRPQVAAAATDWPAPTTTHGTMDSIRSTANNNNNSSSSSSNSNSRSNSNKLTTTFSVGDQSLKI